MAFQMFTYEGATLTSKCWCIYLRIKRDKLLMTSCIETASIPLDTDSSSKVLQGHVVEFYFLDMFLSLE